MGRRSATVWFYQSRSGDWLWEATVGERYRGRRVIDRGVATGDAFERGPSAVREALPSLCDAREFGLAPRKIKCVVGRPGREHPGLRRQR